MFNFVKYNKVTLFFSILLITISIATITLKGFNFSIDFKGGALTELSFANDVKTEEISLILKKEFSEVTVIHYGNLKNVVIQTPINNEYKNSGDLIFKLVNSEFKEVKLIRTEFIGPKIGDELKTNGILALLIVIIGVLIYISISFEFKFAIGAIVALTHDIIISAGMISLLQLSVDLTVLAAMLAILGYSLNDTIVVYDRIREKLYQIKENGLLTVINESLNDTLSRTVMTSFTTSLTLISLLIFGGESLYSFSLILLFGIIIGTYSSIYIASGSLAYLKIKQSDSKKELIDTESGVV